MKFLLPLFFAVTLVAAPLPDSELDKITPAQIEATKKHEQSLRSDLQTKLEKANEALSDTADQLGQAQTEKSAALEHVTELQKQINIDHAARLKAEAQVAEDAKKIARFNRLVRWLAAIAATLAAFAVWQMLKPGGLIGVLAAASPLVTFGAPVAVWIFVFGNVEVYLRDFI